MPIRPENRARYGTPAEWAATRAGILRRSLVPKGADVVPRCECLGECGRGTHTGRCPNVDGGFAYDTGSRVVLTVAHLDHTPENNDPANLRAMCNGCHLHYDRDHHAETRSRTRREEAEAAGQLQLEQVARDLVERQRTCHERVDCPKCHAPAGERCRRARAQHARRGVFARSEPVLKHSHAERVVADGTPLR